MTMGNNNKTIVKMDEREIRKLYTQVTFKQIKELAYYLEAIHFPQGKKINYKGETVSSVNNPSFWLDYDEVHDEPILKSNLVPHNPENLYFEDLLNYRFLLSLRDSIVKASEAYIMRDEARRWIEAGKKCVYRYGWKYRGAGCREITKEKALELFPKYDFGKGFWSLSWITEKGENVLEFNELSENDMW